MLKTAKVLVYLSSANKLPLKEGGTSDVGVFLGELTQPLIPLHEEGYHFTLISPDGNPPTIDKHSYHLLYWKFSKKKLNQSIAFYKTLLNGGMESPEKASDIINDKARLETFDCLFIPGGHAPMTDIVFNNWLKSNELNQDTAKLVSHFHQQQKPTAAICHGVAALATAPEHEGKWIYDGYTMTCVTLFEDWMAENMPFFKTLDGHMADYPTKMLQRRGAVIQQKFLPMLSQVVEDRELITAQDPYAAEELGKRLRERLALYIYNRKMG